MKIRPPVRLAAAVVASLALAGCVSSASDTATPASAPAQGPSGAAAAEKEPIVIGVVMAKSGFMGPIDTPALNAMTLAADELNATGGIDGAPVNLQLIDTGTKLDRYATAATELVGKGAKAMVVSCDYDVSVPAAQVAQSANIVTIAPCVGDPIFGPEGGLPMGFSMGNGTPGEASIMAEFANSKSWKNAVLLRDTTLKYTQNQCDVFGKRFTELGGTVVASYDYKQGDSVKETVSKIAGGTKPDVVANCGYNPGGATVAKELRDGGVTAPVVSGFGMDGDFWTSGVPGLKDYYVVTYAAKNGDDPDAAVNEAAAAYEKKFGNKPDVGGFVTGQTTLQALQSAYEKAGSWDGAKMTGALEGFEEEPFLAGPTSFSKDLHINVERPMRVLEVKDGKLAFVEQRKPDKVVFPG